MKTLELTLISFLALVISPATAAPGLTLSEALRAAMRQNPDITSARHRQDAAEWGRSAARGAFLPKIVAEGSWTQLDPVPTREITLPLPAPLGGPQTREIELGDEETKKISAVITQNVFASGADWFSWRAASAGAEAARFGAEATRQNTALECARVFGLVLLAEAQERAFANMVTMKERTFLEINSGFRVGRASELDRLKAESALETVRADWNQAKARVAQARMNLSRLMGRPLEDQEKIEGQLDIQHSEASSEVMTSDPVSTNPQWRALELLADQKVAQAREATARHLPSVTIGARRDWATPFASQD
jgi:outer membrane protein TolC